MDLLFAVFLMLSGQPHVVAMNQVDLGQVTMAECRDRGAGVADALMRLSPQCHSHQCFALLACRPTTAPDEPGEPT